MKEEQAMEQGQDLNVTKDEGVDLLTAAAQLDMGDIFDE
jgi:hypothetical protein